MEAKMREWSISLVATICAFTMAVCLWRAPISIHGIAALLTGYLAARTRILYQRSHLTYNQKLREIFDDMQQVSIHRSRDGKRYAGPLAYNKDGYVGIYVVKNFNLKEHVALVTNPGEMMTADFPKERKSLL